MPSIVLCGPSWYNPSWSITQFGNTNELVNLNFDCHLIKNLSIFHVDLLFGNCLLTTNLSVEPPLFKIAQQATL